MKKLIIITISIFLFLGLWQTVQAVDLLLDYPDIPHAGKLGEEGASTLPEVIRYIYMFALGAAGFVALLAILIGAIMYIFSAGNPSKATDAKDRIMSALLGILILLASVLILRTINPDLVNIGFVLPTITPATPPTPPEGGNICKCVQRVINATNIPEGTSDRDQWCQQYEEDNCPSNAVSCSVVRVDQAYTGTWWCNWEAMWSARFEIGPCTDCRVDGWVCSRYFNNALLTPCSSAGVTCSANCL